MANLDEDTRRRIQHNAALVVEQMQSLTDFDFGYDEASVSWLDGYINRMRTQKELTSEKTESSVQVLASYLGECIIHTYGGRWDDEGGEIAVLFSKGNSVYPFNKVKKQFANGSEDSINSLFTLIPIVFAAHMEPAA